MVVKECRNRKCRQLFGIVNNLLEDKKGMWKARCPHCRHLNRLTKTESQKVILKKLKRISAN